MRPDVAAFHDPATGTWSYVVSDLATRKAAIIDPVLDFDAKAARTTHDSAQKLVDHVRANDLDVRWLLETHAHADHLSDAQWLLEQFPGATLGIGTGIRQTQRSFAPVFEFGDDVALDGSQFGRLFEAGDRFAIGDIDAEVIAAPGHTADCVAYRIGDALFCGDTLFMPDAGTARTDFPNADAAMLYRTIQSFYALPDDTRVFVCHDYGPNGREVACETTIGAQKRDNTHLRADTSEAEYVALRQARDATLPMPALILQSLQVNLRAGALPPPSGNGVRYLRIPLDRV
ncbi:MBL fold metallo-hydrolase [Lysobacter sp. A6]|uniref:MBL fold metallo-hydrolase n=1 Tax=Noviluteimonas lactosilytica TaxID=2888523 RepID=A0ABS8JKK5_9GAMM|nr:MBL fold metallo-hydrolase [Lysobacter lactosilyticus]MCC8364142.1 MBL fold metallo-hydrolase [Lysobacter lactosilyticus]